MGAHSNWNSEWRTAQVEALEADVGEWDLVIVGGGITGAGILREAVRSGYRALLIEQKDFAWGTSSRSSKMVHGGLRYLGSGQIGLTLDSVRERQRLLQEVPGLVDPLPFLMGHYKGVFPGPRIFNFLLAVYDWMAGKRYHRFFSKGVESFWAPGLRKDALLGATQFADAVTDDARLVVRVLEEARSEGGVAINYMAAKSIVRDTEGQVEGLVVQDVVGQRELTIRTRLVVNATGAWADNLRADHAESKSIRPLRGSHLIVPSWRLPVAYSVSFFHPEDKRPVFAFPWEGVTVIGTTDLDHQQEMNHDSVITEEEVDYLIDAVNRQFPSAHLNLDDVISTYSGVRPVVSTGALNPSSEKREHSIWDDAGLVSVAGGKLTTFRLIALDVLATAKRYLGATGNPETSENSARIFKAVLLPRVFNGLSAGQVKRLVGRYGQGATEILANTKELDKIAGTDTLWAELRYAARHELVMHLEDLMLRRTRLGLLLPHGGDAILPRVERLCREELGWDSGRWQEELYAYRQLIRHYYGLPKSMQTHLSSGVSMP